VRGRHRTGALGGHHPRRRAWDRVLLVSTPVVQAEWTRLIRDARWRQNFIDASAGCHWGVQARFQIEKLLAFTVDEGKFTSRPLKNSL